MAETEIQPLVVDARSDRVVLTYIGENDRSARNAPPRDLTENDLARLAFVERIREVGGDVGQPVDHEDPDGPRIERPDPHAPDPELVGAIVAELVASGRFTTDVPKPKKSKAPKDDAVDQPGAPATTPEGPTNG